MLRVFLDLDIDTTATQLGIAPGTVRAHLAGHDSPARRTGPRRDHGVRAMIHDEMAMDFTSARTTAP